MAHSFHDFSALSKNDTLDFCIPLHETFHATDERQSYLLTAEDRQPYKVSFSESGYLTYDVSQKRVPSGFYMYVLGSDYSLYILEKTQVEMNLKNKKGVFHHSHYLAGEKVRGAGFFNVNKDEKIDLINNDSGHYKPSVKQMRLSGAMLFFYQRTKKLNHSIVFEMHEFDEDRWNYLELLATCQDAELEEALKRSPDESVMEESSDEDDTVILSPLRAHSVINQTTIRVVRKTVSEPIDLSGYDVSEGGCVNKSRFYGQPMKK